MIELLRVVIGAIAAGAVTFVIHGVETQSTFDRVQYTKRRVPPDPKLDSMQPA